MRPELALDREFIRRFRNKALVAEEVRHPNVVALYDYAAGAGGTWYIVCEYVEGETIGQVLARGAVFTPKEVAKFAGQLADGLTTVDQKGILHRDVSPDNIMICTDVHEERTAKLDGGDLGDESSFATIAFRLRRSSGFWKTAVAPAARHRLISEGSLWAVIARIGTRSAGAPAGDYVFGCRFLDPASGELRAEDLSRFKIE